VAEVIDGHLVEDWPRVFARKHVDENTAAVHVVPQLSGSKFLVHLLVDRQLLFWRPASQQLDATKLDLELALLQPVEETA